MLEIFMLIWAGRKMARMASEKGRSSGFAAIGICLWLAGELFGFLLGAALGLDMGAYLLALICAAAGLGTGFLIVSRLAPAPAFAPLDVGVSEYRAVRDPANPYSPPRST